MFILPEICTENVLAHLDIVSGVPFLVIPMGLDGFRFKGQNLGPFLVIKNNKN